MSDFDRLLSLADAIARGEPVDPAGDAPSARPQEAGEKPWSPDDLEKLVLALRRIDESGRDPSASVDELSGRSPGRWAHLAILSAIGAGAFGTVYRAHDPGLGVDVALELLAPSESAETTSNFLQMARRLVRVRHPNVVRCYGVDEWAGCAGMWTELVRGETLEQLVLSRGPFSAEEATAIGQALCHAAAVIHQAGLPHTGITARNVMRDASGRIVLIEPISRVADGRTTADVVHGIGSMLSYLATTRRDATAREVAIAAPLASVIERSISSGTGRGFVTLDALESALSRAMSARADATEASRFWMVRFLRTHLLRRR